MCIGVVASVHGGGCECAFGAGNVILVPHFLSGYVILAPHFVSGYVILALHFVSSCTAKMAYKIVQREVVASVHRGGCDSRGAVLIPGGPLCISVPRSKSKGDTIVDHAEFSRHDPKSK